MDYIILSYSFQLLGGGLGLRGCEEVLEEHGDVDGADAAGGGCIETGDVLDGGFVVVSVEFAIGAFEEADTDEDDVFFYIVWVE